MPSNSTKLWVGISLNGLFILLILLFAGGAYYYNSIVETYKTSQSEYCYTIACPCDVPASGSSAAVAPCNGYAIRETADGNYQCSFSPNLTVDKNGTPVN